MAGSAPAAAKPRKTKVRMVPMWVPWDNDGAGGIRLVPADHGHNVVVKDDQGGPGVGYYEAKGFIPARQFNAEQQKALAVMAAAARKEALAHGEPVPAWAASVPEPEPELVAQPA